MSQEKPTRIKLCLPPSMIEGLEQEQKKRNVKGISTLCRILIKERLEELKELETKHKRQHIPTPKEHIKKAGMA